MENASKALIISGVILLSILIIGIGVYIYNASAGSSKDIVINKKDEIQLMQFNNQYELYEGTQSGSNIKLLLNMAATNNTELYKESNQWDICVCIKSKSKKLLTKIKEGNIKSALNTRSYGVFHPQNIRKIAGYLVNTEKYDISLEYNDYGYVWEIWINDI